MHLQTAGLHGSRQLDDRRVRQALDDLTALPLARVPHRPLLDRIWELQATVTAYA